MNNYSEFYDKDVNKNVNTLELENDPYFSFIKGNSFKSLYTPYKNYRPLRINPQNEKEYSLLLAQIYGFMAHDLELYLDVHPNDEKIIKLRYKYENLCRQAFMEYEQKYGALNLESNMLNSSPWPWVLNSFPWEGDA